MLNGFSDATNLANDRRLLGFRGQEFEAVMEASPVADHCMKHEGMVLEIDWKFEDHALATFQGICDHRS